MAERAMVALSVCERVNPAALAYINRLSDWLFTAARVANNNGAADVQWVPGASR
jgi:cob(I)alamin adenosyltransferase